MKHVLILVAMVAASFLAGAALSSPISDPAEIKGLRRPELGSVIGRALPLDQLELVDVGTGSTVRLSELGQRTTVALLVMGAEDTYSCLNYPLEARILRRTHPDWQVTVVGLASNRDDRERLREFFKNRKVTSMSFLAEDLPMLSEWTDGVLRTPFALVTDADGRIILVDPRNGPESAEFPLAQWVAATGSLGD